MTSRGRQYPDGPLAPSASERFMALGEAASAARRITAEIGRNYTKALREAGRRRAAGTAEAAPPSLLSDAAPDAAGQFLTSLLAPVTTPGPPYVHTFVPPEPECDDAGNEIWRPQDPAFTLTERPVADVVAEAGFGPVPQRTEITADFCQCPACREARYET